MRRRDKKGEKVFCIYLTVRQKETNKKTEQQARNLAFEKEKQASGREKVNKSYFH